MKLEYYVFPSSDAFVLACCLASNQALLFSGRPIPQFHVISTLNNQLFPFLVNLIMFSKSSCMQFFSFKTPTQDPHAWSHYDAAGVRSLDNATTGSKPSVSHQINRSTSQLQVQSTEGMILSSSSSIHGQMTRLVLRRRRCPSTSRVFDRIQLKVIRVSTTRTL